VAKLAVHTALATLRLPSKGTWFALAQAMLGRTCGGELRQGYIRLVLSVGPACLLPWLLVILASMRGHKVGEGHFGSDWWVSTRPRHVRDICVDLFICKIR
jgi:hypothetical protein